MQISPEKKEDILLVALQERYASIHKIRERVQSVGIWALGLMLAAGGWIIQSGIVLEGLEKILIVLFLITIFVILRFTYLKDLNTGFKGQQRTASALETELGFYTPGVFNETSVPLYPEKWQKAGTEEGEGRFFKTSYYLIYVGIIFLILVVLLNGLSITSNYDQNSMTYRTCMEDRNVFIHKFQDDKIWFHRR